ncbi:UxaA family hydrolase [Actinoallomurus spadix]|uniref:Altronate dehydratase family protein n=1 Tax=Actinoallomurus spadix TaxID=79912 RepID=A0ABP3H8Z6_9ACTN|nr:UxaA family hydrolase [Actinoallomurus spadix]MCO5988862.1 UxaA family hydrolase [Actinoallomurus spadix]
MEARRADATAAPAGAEPADGAFFQGIVRPDGRVGTRNHLGILTSVNCSATVAKMIASRSAALAEEFPNVDGVVALTHDTGCGMAADGDGIRLLRRTLNGYARHPNFAALLVVGLGCEVAQLTGFDLPEGTPTMTIQELGGTAATVRRGVELIRDLLPEADRAERVPVPASELVLGLAGTGTGGPGNAALGAAADLLVRHGGTVILAGTPQVYGAEHLLARRAVSPEVAGRLAERVRWWEGYARPAPDAPERAVARGGTSPLTAVHEYAEPVTERGLVFMDTPGRAEVSATGQVAGGATVMCFTTGDGPAGGCRPVPGLNLAATGEAYRAMPEDLDLDLSRASGEGLFRLVLEVASGRRTAGEEFGAGDGDFAPWQTGAVM